MMNKKKKSPTTTTNGKMPLFYINNQLRAGYGTADRIYGIRFHVAQNVIDVSRDRRHCLHSIGYSVFQCNYNIYKIMKRINKRLKKNTIHK